MLFFLSLPPPIHLSVRLFSLQGVGCVKPDWSKKELVLYLSHHRFRLSVWILSADIKEKPYTG